MCDVCNGESGGSFVGVAALSTGPCSIAFCDRCLRIGAEPAWALDYLFIHVAGGDIDKLHPSTHNALLTWVDGKYETFEDYVARITPEMVKKELEEYDRIVAGSADSSDN